MKPPFDIAGDLDTPVSAFAKLGAFNPRFLLESVEGGERLARYSFIGFGKCLEVKLDAAGLQVGTAKLPRPANKTELLDALRNRLDITGPKKAPTRVPQVNPAPYTPHGTGTSKRRVGPWSMLFRAGTTEVGGDAHVGRSLFQRARSE